MLLVSRPSSRLLAQWSWGGVWVTLSGVESCPGFPWDAPQSLRVCGWTGVLEQCRPEYSLRLPASRSKLSGLSPLQSVALDLSLAPKKSSESLDFLGPFRLRSFAGIHRLPVLALASSPEPSRFPAQFPLSFPALPGSGVNARESSIPCLLQIALVQDGFPGSVSLSTAVMQFPDGGTFLCSRDS